MPTREANIRVTLRRGEFQAGLRSMESATRSSAGRMSGALSTAMGAGLGAAKKSLAGMFAGLGNHLKTIGTLGGALATGKLIKDAVDLQSKYRAIAYNVSKLPGVTMDWTEAQGMIDGAVTRTGQSAEGLAAAFSDVFESTGDLALAKGTLEAIGTIATATGQDVELIGNMAQMAARKFEVPVEQMAETMSEFESMVGVGGGSLDKLGPKFGMLAGEASVAGLTGASGMKALMNMLILVDNKVGEKAEPALKRMFEVLHDGSLEVKTLEKEMGRGFKFEPGTGAMDKMKMILAKGGAARSKLIEYLTGPSRIAFEEITKTFDAAMNEAIETGRPKAEATDLALAAFERSLSGADRKTRSYADNVEQAKKNMAEDPSVKLRMAINKVQQAFSKPEMIRAIDKIADKLPLLAEKLGDLIAWILDNPMKALGAGVGLRVGGAFVGGTVSNLGTQLLAKIGPGITTGARGMFNNVGAWFKKQDPLKDLNSNAGTLATKFAGAAAAAYLLGKALEYAIDQAAEEYDVGDQVVESRKEIMGKDKVMDELARKREAISAAKTPEQKKAAREAYAAELLKKRQMIEQSIKSESWTTKVVAAAGGAFGVEQTSADVKYEKIKQLDKMYEDQMNAVTKLNAAMWDAANGIGQASKEVQKDTTKGAGTRGAPQKSNNKPGAAPAPG